MENSQLSKDVNAMLNLQNSIKKQKDKFAELQRKVINHFSCNEFEFTTKKGAKVNRFESFTREIDTQKYKKIVNREDFENSVKVVNKLAKEFISNEQFESISEVKEKYTMKIS
jgi:hypothetical protein